MRRPLPYLTALLVAAALSGVGAREAPAYSVLGPPTYRQAMALAKHAKYDSARSMHARPGGHYCRRGLPRTWWCRIRLYHVKRWRWCVWRFRVIWSFRLHGAVGRNTTVVACRR